MTDQTDQINDLPAPFGKIIERSTEMDNCFKLILRESPILNLYDGTEDYRSEILDRIAIHHSISVLMLIPFRQPIYSYLHRVYLARCQYYQDGLLHRLSFHLKLVKQIEDQQSNVLLAEIISSVHRVSNIYIMIPREDRPVYLEIPIEGAPPEVRVLEISLERLKANVPDIKKLSLEKKRFNNIKIHLFDLGEVLAEGNIVSVSEKNNSFEVALERLDETARKKIDHFINQEYYHDRKTEIDNMHESGNSTQNKKRIPADSLILIADDESKLRSFVAQLLEQKGYRTIQAKNGIEAVQLTIKRKPNLVLLDINMPDLNGFDAIRKIKKYRETRNIPIIVVSGNHQRNVIEEALTLDIIDFMVKPFKTKTLFERIERTLR